MLYINYVSIIYYLILGLIGLLVGKFIAFCNEKFIKEEKIKFKDFLKNFGKVYNKQYLIMFLIAIIYVLLLYKFGFHKEFWKNIDLIKFLILTPMLISAFCVDLKARIIPNRLNMLIFEVGILFTFIYGLNNLAIAKDMIFGLILGAGIFLVITLLGGLIAGKEAMGFGDVKFMGAIGFYFGAIGISEVTLLAFIVAAIISIGIIIYRLIKKNKDEYIPFGPFLSLSAVVLMFLKQGTIFAMFMGFCQNISDLIINLI